MATSNAHRLSFTVPGPIRGKQRAGRMRLPGGGIQSFNPKATVSNEKLIRDFAFVQMRGRTPFVGPIRVSIFVFKVPPASWSAKKKENAQYATGKPDIDNIAKLVGDALNKIVWHDDAQIADLIVNRRFDTTERTHIEIVALEGD